MKRLTLSIDDGLMRRLQQRATARGTTLQDLTSALLRQALAEPERTFYTLAMNGWQAVEQPRVDLCRRVALSDVMDGR